jgi:hypothetical protein
MGGQNVANPEIKKGPPRALRSNSRKTRFVAHRTGTAAETIGALEDGLAVSGLTAGQFSAIDAMEHMVNELGLSRVRISTWTTGIYDVQRAREIELDGQISECRVLLDRGTFEKSPKFAGPLIDILGVDAFRCLSVHAKIIIVEGERGTAVMRSSMNLNKNLRTEQFDIDVGSDIGAFYIEWFDALWEESGRSRDNREIIQAVFDRFLALPPEPEKVRATKPARSEVLVEDDLSGLVFDPFLLDDLGAGDA